MAESLKEYRQRVGLTQTQMAERMGMKLKQYQEVENGRAPLLARHQMLLDRASLGLAYERNDLGLLTGAMTHQVRFLWLLALGKSQ